MALGLRTLVGTGSRSTAFKELPTSLFFLGRNDLAETDQILVLENLVQILVKFGTLAKTLLATGARCEIENSPSDV